MKINYKNIFSNTLGFTLIELVVGITISMLLMVSVGIFVSSGMQTIFNGQKTLENTANFTDFSNNLMTSFSLIQSGSFDPIITSSGIIIKKGIDFGNGGFSYIGTEVLDGIYCQSGSEDTNTNSMYIKNFIPFEENGEDIFSNYDEILESNPLIVNGGIYKSFQKENRVAIQNGGEWDIIIGKGIFGDKFIEGGAGNDTYLNGPTGLAKDGNILFISDTLNNRILYYDTAGDTIHLLLDETDGLNEPTGLYFENNNLYIANSGNGEILKYSSQTIASSPTLTMSGFSISNVNKIDITFSGASNNTSLSGNDKNNFTLTNSSSSTDYISLNSNNIKYYLVNYNSNSFQGSCSGSEIDLISDNPIQCVSSGTGRTSIYQNKTISNIEIKNIINTSNTGSYFVNLKLLNSSNTVLYQNYFPYFVQGDNDILTPNDNTLSILYSGLNYPTGIWSTGILNYNEFIVGINDELTYHSSDNVLGTPIKSLDITYTVDDLLSIYLKYYRRYNCYNLDDNNERTFLLKKNLK